jgi:asparagine synthase (glutamine-hydrolysing)
VCGFVGWVGTPGALERSHLRRATERLEHRGPDDQGLEVGDGWALGFRRLSILDLSERGRQPMATPDGRYRLVCNGEIYNHVELRPWLATHGVTLRSTSDTEVVLHALAIEGPAALHRLNGMFALAFVDTWERTLLLARDRVGVKPLLYRIDGDELRFASELKALLALPGAARELDPRAVNDYLALGYLPGERSIFEGYRKLAPGTYLEASLAAPSRAKVRRYWSIEVDASGPAWSDEELAETFEDAVRIRLRSDVPVGLFLSSGIDSGLVAAFAAATSVGPPPLALTVSYPGEAEDETPLAAATAQHLGLPHVEVVQTPTALEHVDRLTWYFDEPFGDPSALATFALCEAAASHATVFLSGDGGDEAFAGYRRYLEAARYTGLRALGPLRGPLGFLASGLPATSALRFRLGKATLPDDGYAAVFDTVPDDPVTRSVLGPRLRGDRDRVAAAIWEAWASTRGRSLGDRQRQLDYRLYLPDDVLVKVDRASMAHSIEVRSPFLDYRLVERAAQVAASQLVRDGVGKAPLRSLAAHRLPPAVTTAEKRGFAVPVDAWFSSEDGARLLEDRLTDPGVAALGLWDTPAALRVLEQHRRGRGRRFGDLLWRLLVLASWSERYAVGPVGAAPPLVSTR